MEFALNLITFPLTVLNSALITLFSALIIVGAFGPLVLISRCLSLFSHTCAHAQSRVMRVWFLLFLGHIEQAGGMTLKVSGDAFRPDETALVIANHRTWIDSVILFSLARQVGRNGDCKFLAKRTLLLFPVFGFIGAVTDSVVFIQREAKRAGQAMGILYNRLTTARPPDLPFWLIIYPEGTRRTPAKLRTAQDFAKKRDLKPLQHVLQPRTKGFVSMANALRGHAEAVYDVTIAYGDKANEEVKPSFLRLYFTTALQPRVIHIHQRRIQLGSVPENEHDAKQWLYKLYEQKDEMLDHYYKHGKFQGPPMRWNRISMARWLECTAYCTFVAICYTVIVYATARYVYFT